MEGLYKIEEMLCDELSELGRQGGLTNSSLDKVDKMSHALKNVQKIISNLEGNSGDYSGNTDHVLYGERSYGDRSYDDGRSYDGDRSYRYGSRNYRSYASGRDRMGRYTSRASSPEEMKMQLRQMADDAPNSKIKKGIEELIGEMG